MFGSKGLAKLRLFVIAKGFILHAIKFLYDSATVYFIPS